MAIRESVTRLWSGLDRGLKLAFSGAAVLAVAVIIWGVYLVVRDDYGTLFSQLAEGDAAAIVDALKRQKVPYKLADGGTTISVPAERVHETRLGLMSSNVSLSGGVGFEIFDKQGLGATEQSQRVSYQRALQGELARTISALENVKQARVHLVLPESSLFKRDKQDATAAVTLTMKPGNALDRQQIIGVQRLVAASVAGLDPSRVIITDQRGITLSAVDPATGTVSGVEARLELQRQVEVHIAQKIGLMLDSAYGSGQAIISVAAVLSFDATKITTQDLLPVKGGGNESGLVRKRQTITGMSNSPEGDAADTAVGRGSSTSTLEVDYEYGRRVEEVIAAPGAVKRITVGVIVPPHIDREQQSRIKEFVEVAAGIDASRGDVVSIQSLTSTDTAVLPEASGEVAENAFEQRSGSSMDASKSAKGFWTAAQLSPAAALGILLVVLLLGGVAGVVLRDSRPRSLSADERTQLLKEVRRAMGDDGQVTTLQTKQS